MGQKTVVQWLDFVPNGWRSMEQFLFGLDQAMRERGWQTVYVFAGEPSEFVKTHLHALGSPYLVSVNPLAHAEAVALGGELRAWRPALIQTHFLSKFDPALKCVKLHSGARRLVVADHSSGAVSRKPWPLLALAWLRGRWTARHVDLIVGVSDFVCRRDIEEVFFPAHQVVCVHNGVDLKRFVPPARPAHNDVFTVAFVGQLIEQKGVQTLIAAIKVLRDEGMSLRLLIAGQGPHGEALRQQVQQAGLNERVDFLGQIDWAVRLYGEADVVVAPSEWAEAFGFVVAEAAASGGCVVCSDAGGLPEVLGGDGLAGRMFPKGNVAALASVLRELHADPAQRQRLRVAARQRMQVAFSLEAMIEGHARHLDQG